MTPRTGKFAIAYGLGLAYLAAFQLFKLPPCLPVLLETYQYDRTLAGGFMSVYALVGIILSAFIGRWIERRNIIHISLLALVCMLAGNAVSLSYPQSGAVMLAGRGFEGFGFAILGIAGPVIANRHADTRTFPIVVSLTALWIPLGQVAATLLAAVALPMFDWAAMWWLCMALTVGMGMWTALMRRTDGGAVTDKTPDQTTRTLTPDQRRALLVVSGVFCLWACQYFAFMTWFPQYLVEVHQLSLADSLFGYLLPVIIILIVCIATGFLLRHGFSARNLLLCGLLLQTVVWWSMVFLHDSDLGIVCLLIYGVAAGITPACLFAMPGVIVKSNGATATAFGLVMTGRNLGVFVGPILLAQIFTLTGSWDNVAPILALDTTVAALGGLVLTRMSTKRSDF